MNLAHPSVAACAVLAASTTAAQCPWTVGTLLPAGPTNQIDDMVYDDARQEVITYSILIGGEFTYAWDGTAWSIRSGTGLPRTGPAGLASDTARQRVVCNLPNASNAAQIDTYEWDGTAWSLAATNAPSGKMEYDSARQETVLFGGTAGNETWVWDGSIWTQRFPANVPPAVSSPAMGFDTARGVMIMYGGSSLSSGVSDELWEWNGADWQQIHAPGRRPPPLVRAGMDFDDQRQKIVMVGGNNAKPGFPMSTWTYDGCGWERILADNPPLIGGPTVFAHHTASGLGVTFNGLGTQPPVLAATDTFGVVTLAPTLGVTGSTFSIEPSIENTHPGIAYQWSKGGVPLTTGPNFSGVNSRRLTITNYNPALNDTYSVQVSDSCRTADVSAAIATDPCPGAWVLVDPSGATPLRGATMAFQSNLNQSVLYGGLTPTGSVTIQTNLWNGSNWFFPFIQGNPGARFGHSAAHAPSDPPITLVHGGVDAGNNPLNHTLTFDGGLWSTLSATGPSSTFEAAMVFDTTRFLHFGGENTLTGDFSNDTFAFDGSTWSALDPALSPNRPNPRAGHAMAYSPLTGTVIMFGGHNTCGGSSSVFADTWSFNGTQWSLPLDESDPRPPARSSASMVWDDSRQAFVLFGGWNTETAPATFYDDTWQYREQEGWTRLGMNSPPARHDAAMTWDPNRRQTVLATGQGADSLLLSDTWELNFPVEFPRITAQPNGNTIKVLQNGVVTVSAAGTGPLSYMWLKNNIPVVNGPRISGQGTPTLSFSPAHMGDAGTYRCDVSNICGTVSTNAVLLDVLCWVDVNQSGTVDPADFTAWLAAFNDPLSPNRARADQNCDGMFTPADFTAWLGNFNAGCP